MSFCVDGPEINSSAILSILVIQSWSGVENKHVRLGNIELIKEAKSYKIVKEKSSVHPYQHVVSQVDLRH